VSNSKLSPVGGQEQIIQLIFLSFVQLDQHLIHLGFPGGYHVKQRRHGGVLASLTIDLQLIEGNIISEQP
jgi:hypothetical protein